jgi:hypothetical protein
MENLTDECRAAAALTEPPPEIAATPTANAARPLAPALEAEFLHGLDS